MLRKIFGCYSCLFKAPNSNLDSSMKYPIISQNKETSTTLMAISYMMPSFIMIYYTPHLYY